MIRSTRPDDISALIALAVAAEMFPADDTSVLDTMFADYFGREFNNGDVCVTDDDGGPVAIAYFSPAAATDRVWYLVMIGVHPDFQGQGRGTLLLQNVENALRSRKQRLLLVETSGLPSYERTRAFYFKCGYEEEARIRDYYEAGEDMVVFRKALDVS